MDNSLEFIYFLHDTIKMMYKEINIFLGYNNAKNIITRYYHGRQKAFTLNFTLIMALGKCNEFEEAIRMIECGGHDIHSKRDRKMIIVYYLVEGIYKNANYGYKTRINTYREKKLELKEKYNIKL